MEISSPLVKAGKDTNFIFEVVGNVTPSVMDEFNAYSMDFQSKFRVLSHHSCDIRYVSMESSIFEGNLRLIDGHLPQICAYILEESYSSGINKVSDLLSLLAMHNPCGYNLSMGHPFYTYKFKKFLIACALGMHPTSVWFGTADVTDSFDITRENGQILHYSPLNQNEFEDYLINNTKLEIACDSRYEFGSIYTYHGNYYIKLNLQIDFIK